MSRLEQIDQSKPLTFYGSKTIKSDDPVLVKLASSTGIDNLMCISSPATEAITLSPEDGARLLNYLTSCCWREDFDKDLQCISETELGEPLLTGWMSLEQFNQFVTATSEARFPICDISLKLSKLLSGWTALDIDEVTFTGFRLEP